ncbi:polyadenylate-binding protein-interacting protein 7 isoform X2 [Cajanus cajan]|uniref:polyadenylate-binding protein-interacting protein 7 isoform X2 n=1 Tax=Cajanus cajan TaxID=3821 RepID=UPI00098DBE38|nr:polyadenylate-binding protein-interacting protein 7 isoform X2 [Cajanus cajan]
MNLSKKVSQTDAKLLSPSKATTLNPNAAEFIPFSLRSLSGTTSSVDTTATLTAAGALGKAVLDRSESSISNNSDDEVHQYWRCRLPDDITPDFKVMGEDESRGLDDLSLAGLSIHDDNEASRFPSSKGSKFIINGQEEKSQQHINGNSFADKLRFSNSSYREDPSSASFLNAMAKPWDRAIGSADQHISCVQEGLTYDDNSSHGYLNDVLAENAIVDDTDLNPLEFLASLFPGFAAESLAEVYFAHGCDLHLTTEMLSQLELQVDGSFNQNLNSKTMSTPNLSAMDFPALTSPDGQTASVKYVVDNVQQSSNPYRSSDSDVLFFKSSSPVPSRDVVDFASAVRKLASQDSGGIWKYDKNGSGDAAIGSSRSSNVLASGYNGGQGRAHFGDRLQNRGSARAAPIWLETGDAVANMYSELREEARDHACLRNAYFEQARQAYLIGNKALAKELSAKGQLHNMHMKAAHGKAQESIYRQRDAGQWKRT